MTTPELLAPAGEPRALRAALAAGADAVYFGLERWSARAFAGNFGAARRSPEAVETRPPVRRARVPGAQHPAQGRRGGAGARGAGSAVPRRPRRAHRRRPRASPRACASEYPDLPLHASTQLDTHSSAQLAALAAARLRARRPGPRAQPRRDRRPRDPRPRARGLRPRRPLLRLLRRLPAEQHGRRAQRQPRPLQPVVPPALRCAAPARRGAGSRRVGGEPSRRPGHVHLRPRRHRRAARPARRRRHLLQDRGPHEGRRLRGRDDGRLPRGARRGRRRPRRVTRCGRSGARASSRASRAASPRRISRARHDEVRSGGRGGHRGVLVGRVERVRRGARATVEVRLSKPVAAGDVVYLYTPWGQTEPRAPGGGRRRERHAARARARRRQGPPLPPRRGRRRRAGPRPGHRARRPAPDRASRMRLDGEEGSAGGADRHRPGVARARSRAVDVAGAAGGGAHRRPDRGPSPRCPRRARRHAVPARAAWSTPSPTASSSRVGELKELRRRAVAALDERRVAARRRRGGRVSPARGRRRRSPAALRGRLAAGPPARPSPARAPELVLRLRPGATPLPLPAGGAFCLDLLAGDPPAAVARALATLRALGAAGPRPPARDPLRRRRGVDRAPSCDLPWDAVVVRSAGLLRPAASGAAAAPPAASSSSTRCRA